MNPAAPHASTTAWKNFPMEDDFTLRFACVESELEIASMLKTFSRSDRANRTILLVLSSTEKYPNLSALLDLATNLASRVVLTIAPTKTGASTTVNLQEIRGLWPSPLMYEPDLRHAVIGLIMSAQPSAELCVVCPTTASSELHAAIHLGARWRESFEQPENGIFHSL